jgi:hypothetical protein
MLSRFSRLLAIAIALVLPLQGMAAVTAGVCMALHHHDVAAGATDHHGDHHAQGATDQDHKSGPTPGKTHCGPCVACCATASISSALQIFLPEPRAMDAIVVQWLSPEGYQPDGLFRPPLAL